MQHCYVVTFGHKHLDWFSYGEIPIHLKAKYRSWPTLEENLCIGITMAPIHTDMNPKKEKEKKKKKKSGLAKQGAE